MAESIGQRASLPSLSYLDTEKIKREQLVYNDSIPVTSSLSMTTPSLVSPTTSYSGPPPPYSYPSSAASSSLGAREPAPVPAPHAYAAPAEQRHSYEEKDRPPMQPPRQSLPSISEALNGGDHGMSIKSILTSGAAASPPRPQYVAQSPTSPTSPSYQDAFRQPSDQYTLHTASNNRLYESYERTTRPPYSPRTANYKPPPPPSASGNQIEAPRAIAGGPLQTRPGAGPTQTRKPPSPVYHHYQGHRSPPPVPPYTSKSFSAPYSYPSTNPPVSSYTPAPLQPPAWPTSKLEQERAEEIQRNTSRESPAPKTTYGESVKRHLDIFEIEMSLNEIIEGSGHALEFARNYGNRAHQTQRSGPVPGSLPSIAECDDLMSQQQRVMDSMGRIRDLILRQQAALANQRTYDQRALKSAPSEADEDTHYMEKLDGAGGFAGPDAKKRRGRAAPPGRCHSCNRAETPEWRRGPDGARTLCNACGLHYAKLQRKMDSKDSGAGPSKLRPKESGDSSP